MSILNTVEAAQAPPSAESRLAAEPVAAPVVPALTRDFLAWVAGAPRSYADAMEAWRSSCPRLTIWEDALGDGLVRVERGSLPTLDEMLVTLTLRGRALLDGVQST
jgi:hypothetical protein